MEYDLPLCVSVANDLRVSLYLFLINPLAMRATQALIDRAISNAFERPDVVRSVLSGWRKLVRVWLPDISISGRYAKYVVTQFVLAVIVKALEALAEFGFDSRQVPNTALVVHNRYGYVGDLNHGRPTPVCSPSDSSSASWPSTARRSVARLGRFGTCITPMASRRARRPLGKLASRKWSPRTAGASAVSTC